MSDLCSHCNNSIPLEYDHCPHCCIELRCPNVRIANSPKELDALQNRYDAALDNASTRGCSAELNELESLLSTSESVLACDLSKLYQIATRAGIFANYYDLLSVQFLPAAVALLQDGDAWKRISYSAPEVVVECASTDAELILRNSDDVQTIAGQTVQQVSDRLQDAVDETEAIDLVLLLLNPTFEDETKCVAALELEELLGYPEIKDAVLNVLLASPLPEAADGCRAADLSAETDCPRAADFLHQLLDLQPAVSAMRDSWQDVLSSEKEHDFIEGRFVRHGLFRKLVTEISTTGSATNFAFAALKNRALQQEISNYRGLIARLCAPFRSIDQSKLSGVTTEVAESQAVERDKASNRTQSNDIAKQKVEELKEKVIEAMKVGDERRIQRDLNYLKTYQLERSNKTLLCMSLCDLAQTAATLGQFERQLELTKEATKLNPVDASAWQQYGMALKQNGDLQTALSAMDRAVQVDGRNPVAGNGRGEVLKAMGRFEEALETFDQVIKQHPKDVVAKNGRGEVLKAMGRFEEALVAFGQVTKQQPEDVVAKTSRAEVLKEMGRLEEALEAFEQVIKQHPKDVVAKTSRGEVLKAMGRFEEALEAFEQVIKQHPKDVVAKTSIASVYVILGEWDNALAALLPCESPQSRDDWINSHIRAMIFLHRGEFSAAEAILQDGIDSCPFADCLNYYHGAMAALRIRQRKLKDAADQISQLSDGFRTPRLALQCELAILAEDTPTATAITQDFPQTVSPNQLELFEELKRRAVGKPAQHDADWIFHHQLNLLAA